jgi:hypothetical protein
LGHPLGEIARQQLKPLPKGKERRKAMRLRTPHKCGERKTKNEDAIDYETSV